MAPNRSVLRALTLALAALVAVSSIAHAALGPGPGRDAGAPPALSAEASRVLAVGRFCGAPPADETGDSRPSCAWCLACPVAGAPPTNSDVLLAPRRGAPGAPPADAPAVREARLDALRARAPPGV